MRKFAIQKTAFGASPGFSSSETPTLSVLRGVSTRRCSSVTTSTDSAQPANASRRRFIPSRSLIQRQRDVDDLRVELSQVPGLAGEQAHHVQAALAAARQ